MLDLFVQALVLIACGLGVGVLASMLGVGGGIILVPFLIIAFGLSPSTAPGTTLVAALFVAMASLIPYYRQKPSPIIPKAGLLLALTSVPGSLIGVWLREIVSNEETLRLVFAAILMPIALKMLFAKRRGKADRASEVGSFDLSRVSRARIGYSLIGSLCAGILSGLLGLGGGILMVPVLNMMMGLPIHAAVATSMLTMVFTATSGTVMNYLGGQIHVFYALTISLGMIVGAQFGPRLVCKINAVLLKQLFGVLLVLPLVQMARLGQLWLDPSGLDFLMVTIGNIVIWLVIVIPVALYRTAQSRRLVKPAEELVEKCDQPSPE
ncbi:MAG: sulfite exporter TauE/SafE family protein [Candidatus Thorarchaeota archaeon]|nr:MAG: sulfite exporter TauE/SafE family protein [Candidatus Thorarchaeota archaeon]